MGRLSGRAALVTGGTSGIGAGIVRRFAAEGAGVAFTGRDEDRGAAVAAETGATFLPADVRSDADADRSVAQAAAALGGLDVLVCNAGTGHVGALLDTSSEELNRILDVNVTGCLRYVRAAIGHLEARGGCVIHIASDAGVIGEDEIGAYSVSKAAVIMLGRMLAVDCGRRGVRANTICPGDIFPGMREMVAPGEESREDDASDWPLPPVGRIGQAEDVAGAAVFLASADAAFVNGAQILVDGGMRAGMRAGGPPVSPPP
jgi:NAD(P)-dependent dehydrogenase (short-subunit alcohol dehydrogenase family)